jgi:hypothetical protein
MMLGCDDLLYMAAGQVYVMSDRLCDELQQLY